MVKRRSPEFLRSTPAMPTTFAEAALLASKKLNERQELSLSKSPLLTSKKPPLEPRNIFGSGDSRAQSFGSCSSQENTDMSSLSLESDCCSPSLKAHGVGDGLSSQFLSLTIDPDKNESDDSFSSQADSKHNKGAIEFIELVEAALLKMKEADTGLKLEKILLQMIDLDIGRRIPTPQDIAPALEENGWSFDQVARLWTVSSGPELTGPWNDAALVSLGGRGMVGRMWNELKDSSLTGFPKRPAEDGDCCAVKKRRMDQSCSKVSHSTESHANKVATCVSKPESDSCKPNTVTLSILSKDSPQQAKRRMKVARKKLQDQKNKITSWLENSDASTPTKLHSIPPSSPVVVPATPETPDAFGKTPTEEKKKRQRKRRKIPRKNPATPCPTPNTLSQKNKLMDGQSSDASSSTPQVLPSIVSDALQAKMTGRVQALPCPQDTPTAALNDRKQNFGRRPSLQQSLETEEAL